MTRKALTLVLTAVVAATVALSGCGRKGPLERPKTAEKQPAEGPSSETDVTVRGPKRPFILDRLIR